MVLVGAVSASFSLGTAASAWAQSSSERAEALVRAGLKDARKGKFNAARTKFEEAVKLDPSPVYMHNLARALQKLGELPQAFRWFSQALRTDSEYKFAADARKHLKTISKKLKKTHGQLRVQSTPREVTCSITTPDGKSENLVKTPFERWVPAGTVTVKGRQKGYLDGAQDVVIEAGQEKTVKLRLEPEPVEGYLQVLADAPNAVVYINGKKIGPAPLKNHLVTSGSYSVEVRAPKYKTFKKVVVVEPDATERLVARMELIGSGSTDSEGGDPMLGYITVGSGSALTLVGGILVGVAYAKKAQYEPIPRTPEGDAQDAEVQGLNAAGWVLVGVGLAAVGVGIYLIISSESEGDDTAALDLPGVLPTLSIDESGASAGAVIRF